MEHFEAVVVGGGQAGLSVSHELSQVGVEHVVLERGRVGQTWRDRWDSFCLVTPNWTVQLPGGRYDGDDPDGYMLRDQVVASLDRYRASFEAPLREGVDVRFLASTTGGGFRLATSAGDIRTDRVVLATGAYQRSHRPAGAETLPPGLLQIDVADYRNPAALPPGDVLVVGSGQSGCQLAEELHEAGRRVVLSCGRAPWVARRIGGRDIVSWMVESGFFEQQVASLSTPAERLVSNVLATGHGGGHDLHYRTLRAMGVSLAGHFLGATDRFFRFAADLGQSVAWGDDRHRQLTNLVRKVVAERGLPPVEIPEPEPFDPGAPEEIPLAGFGAVVFAGGFRPDYRSWVPWLDAFDDAGYPIQVDGASSVVDGLFFVGVHFMRKRKSSLLMGVGEDAAIVARAIAERRR